VAGLQARSAPSVAYVRDLIKQGYAGQVLSTTLIGSGMGWGPTVEPSNEYLNDKKNGATMLSIALGHAADALCHCLGEIRELSATMTQRRKSFTIAGNGEPKPMMTEDQVAVSGLLDGGLPQPVGAKRSVDPAIARSNACSMVREAGTSS
jgi:predicted dehydrogenase